jgi:DAPG hydrolase PhiG domain
MNTTKGGSGDQIILLVYVFSWGEHRQQFGLNANWKTQSMVHIWHNTGDGIEINSRFYQLHAGIEYTEKHNERIGKARRASYE